MQGLVKSMEMNSIIYYTFAVGSGLFWLLAYTAIIWRGFRDRTFSMPIISLTANAAWEAIFSFFYIPPQKLLHYSSIAWFIFDLPIAAQCLIYGSKDFKADLIKKRFYIIFFLIALISFVLLFNLVYEFADTRGVYSGFGINFMMSILYINMLIRRDDILGQSVYIGIFKWMGSLCAFLSLLFPLSLKNMNTQLSIQIIITRILLEQPYPLTTLIKFLYMFTFIIDIIYIFLIYQKYQEKNINPWTRF